MLSGNDELILLPDVVEVSRPLGAPWKILIVDDEPDVHRVTELSLRNMLILDRPLQLIHAYSGEESVEIMRREKDIALVLMDVVMESDHAGLDAVEKIRNELFNQEVRLVLRTGQPGQAPEYDVVTRYDINDYKEKTELTAKKLHTLVHTSVGHYRELMALKQNRSGLERVIKASATIFESRSLVEFARGVLTQLSALLYAKDEGLIVEAMEVELGNQELVIAACLEPNSEVEGQDPRICLSELALSRVLEALDHQVPLFGDGYFSVALRSPHGLTHIVYLSCDNNLQEEDRKLIELFCHNVAIAFDNQALYQEVLHSQHQLVLLLSQAVEERSVELKNHVKRVSEYTAVIGKSLGISGDDLEVLKLSAALHDVGKIGIPDDILNKPGGLTDQERTMMETHVDRGVSILGEQRGELLKMAGEVIGAHHEHWDGNGYPNQLVGEEINLFGRITAIADVFDALSTRRVYKEPWPIDKVWDYFREQRGKQFDPDLVDIFISHSEQVMEIHNRLHSNAV
jgi:response regulator RpfG family c-di-GMP phosphodiesterase